MALNLLLSSTLQHADAREFAEFGQIAQPVVDAHVEGICRDGDDRKIALFLRSQFQHIVQSLDYRVLLDEKFVLKISFLRHVCNVVKTAENEHGARQ